MALVILFLLATLRYIAVIAYGQKTVSRAALGRKSLSGLSEWRQKGGVMGDGTDRQKDCLGKLVLCCIRSNVWFQLFALHAS